ncbi:MAG: GntR family transcriptional regulator [Lachnospiraceae bacterium]|nr:GntR family transcriptional regulator [Lachnospiraceae bacterium]
MPWNLDSDRPIFIQIIDRIQADIIAGCYQPGDKLPSVRELAQDASVNPNTMQKALSELERTGLVYSQRTSGRFITEDREMIRALREQQGQQIALHFLENMKKLGYGKDEILALLTQLLETALHNQPHSTETHGHSAETHTHSAETHVYSAETHTHSAETHVYSAETHGHSIAPHAQPYNAAVHAQPEQKQQHKSSAQESLAEACKITTWRIP